MDVLNKYRRQRENRKQSIVSSRSSRDDVNYSSPTPPTEARPDSPSGISKHTVFAAELALSRGPGPHPHKPVIPVIPAPLPASRSSSSPADEQYLVSPYVTERLETQGDIAETERLQRKTRHEKAKTDRFQQEARQLAQDDKAEIERLQSQLKDKIDELDYEKVKMNLVQQETRQLAQGYRAEIERLQRQLKDKINELKYVKDKTDRYQKEIRELAPDDRAEIDRLEQEVRELKHKIDDTEDRLQQEVHQRQVKDRTIQITKQLLWDLNERLETQTRDAARKDEQLRQNLALAKVGKAFLEWEANFRSIGLEKSVTDEAEESFQSLRKDWSGRGPHAELERGEKLPLEKGRVLGYGLNGEVVEATCKGVKVALKKIHHRQKIRIDQMKEVEVLKKLDHRHIVKVVGTYTQYPYFGLLLWPVAYCDLAVILDLYNYDGNAPDGLFSKVLEDHNLDEEELDKIVGGGLQRIVGCSTRALAYLHENNIRHKDIKPSNILLSRDGLWITDFGSAKDFTDDLTSTSESRERGTLRYCAPEVARYEKSGRSADIFSLGCVFLEILVAGKNANGCLDDLREMCPRKNRSYEANLDMMDRWFNRFLVNHVPGSIVDEIKQMLSYDRTKRPTAKALSLRWSLIEEREEPHIPLHGSCCNIWSELKEYKTRIAGLEEEQRETQR